ncbi:MAG: tetratricopeptide repeat protein [Bacteroidales bacterium]
MRISKKLLIVPFIILGLFTAKGQGLLQKAKSGNVRSMYELANQYYTGIGMLQSYRDAFIWYKQAADRNNVISQYKTAYMYENGLGVTQNLTNAFNYYLQAAERGNESAQLKVAMMFDKGIGTRQSLARAMIWYRVCAQRNESYAQRRLGDMYLEGNPIEQNYQEAAYWYDKAVKQNDTPSMACLAYILCCNKSVKPDYQKALLLLQIPLKNNDPMAQFTYAELLDKGNGVEKNTVEAMKYYNLAGEQGLSLAKEVIAINKYDMYHDFSGFLDIDFKTITRAESWLIIGREYEYGKNLRHDMKEAKKCYERAAELGNIEAINQLSLIEGIRLNKKYK